MHEGRPKASTRLILASLFAIASIEIVVGAESRTHAPIPTPEAAAYPSPHADCFGLDNPWLALPPRTETAGVVNLVIGGQGSAVLVAGVPMRPDSSTEEIPLTVLVGSHQLSIEPTFEIFGY